MPALGDVVLETIEAYKYKQEGDVDMNDVALAVADAMGWTATPELCGYIKDYARKHKTWALMSKLKS